MNKIKGKKDIMAYCCQHRPDARHRPAQENVFMSGSPADMAHFFGYSVQRCAV